MLIRAPRQLATFGMPCNDVRWPVAGQKPGDTHGAVVHLHPLLTPRHGLGQSIEEFVRRGDEARAQVNPGAVGQLPALDGRAEPGDAELAQGTEQRGLGDQ